MSNTSLKSYVPQSPKAPMLERVVNQLRFAWKKRLAYVFVLPFVVVFTIFILLPILAAMALSFTNFNGIERPHFIGWRNFAYLISQDSIFLKYILPNTFKYVLFVGPGGLLLSFILAWVIVQMPAKLRIYFALAFYAPSMTSGVALNMIWKPLLSGDRLGYLNHFMMQFGFISKPILWVQDQKFLMDSMIAVTSWKSMGVGFLAMLAGIINVNPTLYEAGKIDGVTNRLQEIWYITIPQMKPQLMFAAVMAIVGSFKEGNIGVSLSGMNPTPLYSGNLIVTHIEDYGLIRFQLGYASALTIFLLVLMYLSNRLSWRFFGTRRDEG